MRWWPPHSHVSEENECKPRTHTHTREQWPFAPTCPSPFSRINANKSLPCIVGRCFVLIFIAAYFSIINCLTAVYPVREACEPCVSVRVSVHNVCSIVVCRQKRNDKNRQSVQTHNSNYGRFFSIFLLCSLLIYLHTSHFSYAFALRSFIYNVCSWAVAGSHTFLVLLSLPFTPLPRHSHNLIGCVHFFLASVCVCVSSPLCRIFPILFFLLSISFFFSIISHPCVCVFVCVCGYVFVFVFSACCLTLSSRTSFGSSFLAHYTHAIMSRSWLELADTHTRRDVKIVE